MLTVATGGPAGPYGTHHRSSPGSQPAVQISCGSHPTLCCPADVFMVHGLFAQTLKPPLTPGSEGIGTVASPSERFPLGQRVVAGEGFWYAGMVSPFIHTFLASVREGILLGQRVVAGEETAHRCQRQGGELLPRCWGGCMPTDRQDGVGYQWQGRHLCSSCWPHMPGRM